MTEEAINLVELLRDEDNCNVLDYIDDAADLIESLSAELEITEAVAAEARGLECERDQLTVELGQTATKCHQLKSQLDQVTRERDAAVEDLRNGSCSTCAFQSPCIVTGCVGDMGEACKQCPCLDCANGRNWQWRGVEKEVEG